MGHDSGDRPDCGGVFRGKRGTALPELSIAIVLVRALASGHKFEGLHRNQAVDGRFPTQKARFALVLVMGHEPQKVRAGRSSDHGVRAVIGNMTVGRLSIRIGGEMAAEVAIGHEERGGESSKRAPAMWRRNSEPSRGLSTCRSDREKSLEEE